MMKTSKINKIITLAAILSLAFQSPVFAVSKYQNSSANSVNGDYDGNGECIVEAEKADTVTVSIPKNIAIDRTTKESIFKIKINGQIACDEYLEFSHGLSFLMKADGKADVVGTIERVDSLPKWRSPNYSKALAADETQSDTYTLKFSAPGLSGGRWSGNFTIDISVKEDA